MRLVPVALVLVTLTDLGCGNKSKLDVDRAAAVDALWALAPDGTELGLVASPRAIGLATRAVAALRELAAVPDLAPAKSQIDMLARGLFGSETATPADAGFATDRGFAMFATADGVIGVMPVGDRDKFMAAKKGTRGETEDVLADNTCRMIQGHYVCATKPEMFDRLGKGALRGKAALAGARGDAELYMAHAPLLGEATGELAIAAQLEPGAISIHGRWAGTPSGELGKLVGATAPHPDLAGASGFVSLDVARLLGNFPPIPVAGGVTIDKLFSSLRGSVTAVIPSGTVDLQVFAPLANAAPATAVIENCQDIAQWFDLAETQTPGACRFVLRGTSSLELDAWVENATLRLGAHKGPPTRGTIEAATPIARELARGDWTAAFWGRGTMLNLSGIAPASGEIPPQVALGIHAIALVNELAAAAKVDPDGVRFRAFLRTAWTNPPDVVAKISAITGDAIASGAANEPAKAIAAGAPGSPFAADFAAGQGGLMVPAAVIGVVSSIVIPALLRYASGETPEQAPDQPPMDSADLAKLLIHAYVEEAYPQWQKDHPGKTCPAKLDELATYFGENPGIPVLNDPWDQPLILKCGKQLPAGATGIAVLSRGADGEEGTADDIRSW